MNRPAIQVKRGKAMRARAVKRWLATLLVSPAFVAGCQHYGCYQCAVPGQVVATQESEPSSSPSVVYLYSETPINDANVAMAQIPRLTTEVASLEYKPDPALAKKSDTGKGFNAGPAKPVATAHAELPRPPSYEPPKPPKVTLSSVTPAKPQVKVEPPSPPPGRVASVAKPPVASGARADKPVVVASTSATGNVPDVVVPPLPDDQLRQTEATQSWAPDRQVQTAVLANGSATSLPGQFAHSVDYTELKGQLQNSRLTKGWRLRYAPIDETDEYGGSVRFTEDSQMDGFEDGQMVRVRGRLIADGARIAPYYRVDAIEVVK
jgi:hypothetical protein